MSITNNAQPPLKSFLLLVGLVCASWGQATTLQGRVVEIADGDTVTVLDANMTQHRIRLSGIDAPEKKQPFGQRSQQSLAALVFTKNVTVEYSKRDRYGRIVGKILANNTDMSLEQVRRGLAWHYKTYEREQSGEDRRLYSAEEERARAARRGLWREPNPTPPWEYRGMR